MFNPPKISTAIRARHRAKFIAAILAGGVFAGATLAADRAPQNIDDLGFNAVTDGDLFSRAIHLGRHGDFHFDDAARRKSAAGLNLILVWRGGLDLAGDEKKSADLNLSAATIAKFGKIRAAMNLSIGAPKFVIAPRISYALGARGNVHLELRRETQAAAADTLDTIHVGYAWSPWPRAEIGVAISGGDAAQPTQWILGAEARF